MRLVPVPLALVLSAACVRQPEPAEGPPAPAVADAAPARPAAAPVVKRSRKCMGTNCELQAVHPDEGAVDRAFDAALAEIDRLEALMTSWRPDSEISRVSEAAGRAAVKVSPETLAVVQKALWVAQISGGAFDVTVGVYRGLWKFDEDNDGTLPSPREVERRRKLVSWRDVVVDEAAATVKLRRRGQRLNVEGIAKGYIVDAAVRILRDAGVRDFILKAGGDLYASGRRGDREWRVGIQDPRATLGRIIYMLPLSDQAFNTSGDYERFILREGVRYHHILDPRTGFPARKSRSVTVLAGDAFTADALDTALFVMGAEAGMKIVEDLPGVEAVFVDAGNRVHVSSGLRDRLVKRGEPTDGI